MLRSLIYITLAWTVVLNSMVYSVIKAGFTINQKYIIENFCINKDKPELNCDGKCFLAQKIKEEQERKESLPAFTFQNDFGIFIPINLVVLTVDLEFEPFQIHSIYHLLPSVQTAFFDIEHPPQV
jgi:hypothetical protein